VGFAGGGCGGGSDVPTLDAASDARARDSEPERRPESVGDGAKRQVGRRDAPEIADAGSDVGLLDAPIGTGPSDSGSAGAEPEAGKDSGPPDARTPIDAGPPDTSTPDTSTLDASAPKDAATRDVGALDVAVASEASDVEAGEAGCTGSTPVTLTVLNVLVWCSVSIEGAAPSSAAAQTVCVAPGIVSLAASPLPGFELGPAPWYDTSGDLGSGDPGTVVGDVDSTTVMVTSGSACVWVCCPFPDGTGCPTADQCH
jgi:hypothetical protein